MQDLDSPETYERIRRPAQHGNARLSKGGATCVKLRVSYQLGVVLLQHALDVRVGVGASDHRVGLASLREARVVDGRHPDTERNREGRLVGGERHLVQHDALEVA